MPLFGGKGGDEERETCILEQSDVVVGYGGNASLQSLQSQTPITTRFLAYGHKISFGLISRFSLDSQKAFETARQAALDVIRYDQQGCYSPPYFLCPTWRQCYAKRICEISGT
ncbi:acyl-CoA reductase [Peribacillus frigoritolerans]|nr:acyl-CoA reductase [Peribacillus frigoritolerans]